MATHEISIERTDVPISHTLVSFSAVGNIHFCQGDGRELANVGWYNIFRTLLISTTGLSIIIGNIIVLIVLNTKPYSKSFSATTRRFLTSLAVTDLSMGGIFAPFCIVSGLLSCWPHGRVFCQIQALLLAALFHHSTLAIVEIAVDRFIFITYPLRYEQIMTKTRSILIIGLGWAVPFLTYACFIFAMDQYYFDKKGATCEPYYESRSILIAVVTIFYFPPLLALLFIYGVIYRITLKSQARVSDMTVKSSTGQKQGLKNSHLRACKTLGGIALGYFLTVSPWTFTQLIKVLGEVDVNEAVDFITTWIAISNSFWNVVIYSFTNTTFRRATKTLIMKVVCCARPKEKFDASSRASQMHKDVGFSTG